MPFRKSNEISDSQSSVMEPIDENCVPIATEYLNPRDLYGNVGSSERNPGFVQVQLKDICSETEEARPTTCSIEFQNPTMVAIPLQEIDLQFPFGKNQFQYDQSKLDLISELQPQIFRTLNEADRIMKLKFLKPKSYDASIYLMFISIYTLFCVALMVLPFLFMYLFSGGLYVGLFCLGIGVFLGVLGLLVGSNSYGNQVQKRKRQVIQSLQHFLQQENNIIYNTMGLEWKLIFDIRQTTSKPSLILKKK